MLTSLISRSARAVSRAGAGKAVGAQLGPQRFMHATPGAEADSMGSLLEKGKDGAEYVVSGEFCDCLNARSPPPPPTVL